VAGAEQWFPDEFARAFQWNAGGLGIAGSVAHVHKILQELAAQTLVSKVGVGMQAAVCVCAEIKRGVFEVSRGGG